MTEKFKRAFSDEEIFDIESDTEFKHFTDEIQRAYAHIEKLEALKSRASELILDCIHLIAEDASKCNGVSKDLGWWIAVKAPEYLEEVRNLK